MSPLSKVPGLILGSLIGLLTGYSAPPEPPPAADPDNVACRIIEAVRPRFPMRMLHTGVTRGTVNMLLHVDAAGALRDTLVTAYSRKPFADEAQSVVKRWKFVPGRAQGQPVDTIINLTFNFEVNGVVVVHTFAADHVPGDVAFEEFEYQAANVKKLDRVPTPLNIVEPTYPREWMKQGIVGSVAVDFYIDENGRTRFPTAAPGGNEQLAGIAIAAVEQWRFIPPRANGRPVLVKAQQLFQFAPEEKP
jgi:TonB family protein